MARSGGRLNLAGAMNRNMPQNHLNPLTEPSSKQASVCRLERELKSMKEENKRLRVQLEETRSALHELTSEASLEKFDERRVNLLKMQIIQLQRQVLLMSEALGSRSTSLMEVENALTWLSEKFRYFIGLDVKGAAVPVPRSDLISVVEASESARIKLFKNVENCSKENLSQPQMLMNPFLKPGLEKDFTMLDCCLGRVDCLNLKHVAQLESRLSRLYKELIKASEYLTDRGGGSRGEKEREECGVTGRAGGHMSGALREREGTVVLRACAMARECAADLLSLSLLFPAAPWGVLKKPSVRDVTYESLAHALPSLPRGKAGEVQRCITAALQACNHRCHMASQEAAALREEVRFHQAVYQLQLDYISQAFDALRQGYSEFEQSTSELLIQPMKRLLEAYRSLRSNTSSEGLRDFLTTLKQQEPQWVDIIQKLDTTDPENQSGSSALSSFGEEFLSSLDSLVLTRQRQRDKASALREDLKGSQRQLEDELRAIISDDPQEHITPKIMDNNWQFTAHADDTTVDTDHQQDRPPSSSRHHHRTASQAAHASDETDQEFTGLRPWLDDPRPQGMYEPSAESAGAGKKGKKKSHRASLADRQPWQDVGDLVRERSEAGEPFVLPWSSQSARRGEAVTGLRPWLDEQIVGGGEEEGRKPDSSRNSRGGALVHEHSDVPSEGSVVRSVRDDCDSNGSLGQPSVYNSERLPQLSSHRHQHDSPILTPDTNQSPPQQHRCEKAPANACPSQHCDPVGPSATGPPPAGPSTARSRRRSKPKNYEPKLYVANRTLSLRRSGSLNKLSEPSLQEQMARMSTAASQQALDSARARNDSSFK